MLQDIKRLMGRNFLFALGVAIMLFWLVVAVLAPYVTPYDPLAQDFAIRNSAPTWQHVCGTDSFGRDIFSRILSGSRISILMGLTIVAVSVVVGALYGGIAGYVGGVADEVMMRLSELVLSFPPLILAMIIAAALGPNLFNSVLAMAVIWWPNYARLMRSLVIGIKENEHVEAARALGASPIRVLLKEIFPNCLGSMLVMATLDIGNAILVFSGLSFLGLGAPPPTPEWGLMVSDGATNFYYWWMGVFPGLAIFSVAIGANFIGDGLRDFLDPKLRKML